MGVYLELVDHDAIFRTRRNQTPVILNDLRNNTLAEKERINDLIKTTYKGDVMDNVPSCRCGELRGRKKLSFVCSNCGSAVTIKLEQDLEPIVWFKAPEGVKRLISPHAAMMMQKRFTASGFDVIRWVTDTNYSGPVLPSAKVNQLLADFSMAGFKRGLNNFVDNYDGILELLFNSLLFRPKAPSRRGSRRQLPRVTPYDDPLYRLLLEEKAKILPHQLPVPNRALLVLDDTDKGNYYEPIITDAVDVVWLMSGIDAEVPGRSKKVKENNAVKSIWLLVDYYKGIYKEFMAPKPGCYRKHIFGTRVRMSFRAVITSITEPSDHDELYLPWTIAVTVFEHHIESMLLHKGYSLWDAKTLIHTSLTVWDAEIREILDELISTHPYHSVSGKPGIPVIFQRNPSLERGSAQLFCITRIKDDVEDPTVQLSIKAVIGFNADFDGDQMNGLVPFDLSMAEDLKNLSPYMSVFDLSRPRQISGNLSMPKTVVHNIANWIDTWEEEVDPEKERLMDEMFGDDHALS